MHPAANVAVCGSWVSRKCCDVVCRETSQESEAALLKLVSKFADAKSTALGPPVCRFSSVVIREGATVGFVVLTGRWHMLKRTDTILDLREFTRTFWVYGTPTD